MKRSASADRPRSTRAAAAPSMTSTALDALALALPVRVRWSAGPTSAKKLGRDSTATWLPCRALAGTDSLTSPF
jgi:hypothetical protein